MSRPLEPCQVYVDGEYIRRKLRDIGCSEWFDPRKPASVLGTTDATMSLPWELLPTRLFYYDALAEDESTPDKTDELARYLDVLRYLPDTEVREGYVRPSLRRKRQQRGVDVQLAVDALETAYSQRPRAIGLVTGDIDFVPLVEALRRAGPHVFVIGFARPMSSELRAAADRVVYLSEPPTGSWFLQLPASSQTST